MLLVINPNLEGRLIVCMSGQEALTKIKDSISIDGDSVSTDIGLIFTDLSMPMMDGYQFSVNCRRLLRNSGIDRIFQPKIIALTGHTESEFFLRAFKKRIDQVYSKPIASDYIKLVLLENGFWINLEKAEKLLN